MANEIKRLMDRPDRTTGQDTKTLFSAGDQAAVELRKLYDDDFLSQPHNLRSVLWILETAFGMPNWIEHAAGREPRASISLLQSMKATVSDTRFLRAIERLTEKLTRPLDLANDDNVAHVPADGGYWCIDPLAMAIIPLSSRKSAPDLPVGYLGDTPLRLSEYRGRPIVLNVWDDDSRPQAAAVTFGLQQKYQDSRLVVIGMWAGPQRRDLDAYLSRSGMESPDFPIVFGGKDRAHLFGLGPILFT
jgi:hypothetical protein